MYPKYSYRTTPKRLLWQELVMLAKVPACTVSSWRALYFTSWLIVWRFWIFTRLLVFYPSARPVTRLTCGGSHSRRVFLSKTLSSFDAAFRSPLYSTSLSRPFIQLHWAYDELSSVEFPHSVPCCRLLRQICLMSELFTTNKRLRVYFHPYRVQHNVWQRQGLTNSVG